MLGSEAQKVESSELLLVHDYGKVGKNQVIEFHACSVESFGLDFFTQKTLLTNLC